ncbi:hypothetical protein DMB66_27405 [Actinoplanes sp. ATCC 53533]|uniref:hypothetical protein n=1 Tax=Actinoplanes sp. ATCC 53533 TaxID=1288362 RepID=UPI000F79FF2F|nr:hypothetical protein [Actinoplanes sp. ATCC 53533]RSM59565.1 hypothetical protein DMB66_27405 [Actinoplanes sp. ATCC 53533]
MTGDATRPRTGPNGGRAVAGPGRNRADRNPHPRPRRRRRPAPAVLGELSLATVVRRADRAINNQRLRLASWLLRPYLAGRDPRTAPDDPVLIEAAMLWHLVQPADAEDQVAWCCYAYHASRRLHGVQHAVTLSAGGSLAASLALRGDRDAFAVHRAVVDGYGAVGNLDAAIIARTALAGTLHRFGSCAEAIVEARRAWDDWRQTHCPCGGGGLLAAVGLLAILIACRRSTAALLVLAQAAPMLPPPGTTERARFARWAILAIESTRKRHEATCTRTVDAAVVGVSGRPPRRGPPIDWPALLQ